MLAWFSRTSISRSHSGRGGQRQLDAQALLAGGGEGPVERCANVAQPALRSAAATRTGSARRPHRAADLEGLQAEPRMPARAVPRLAGLPPACRVHRHGWCRAAGSGCRRHRARPPSSDLSTRSATMYFASAAPRSCAHATATSDDSGEVPGEDAEAPQQQLLRCRQQADSSTPASRAASGGAPGRRAGRGQQQAEPIVEHRLQAVQPEGIDTRRGQLDGQRHAVEVAADRDDTLGIGIVEAEVVERRRGALDEQLHRGPARRRRRRASGPSAGGRRQRPEPGHPFAARSAAARGWWRGYARLRRTCDDAFGQPRDGIDHVLAAVQQQQQAATGEMIGDLAAGVVLPRRQPQRRGQRAGHQRRLLHQRQVDENDTLDFGGERGGAAARPLSCRPRRARPA